MYLSVAAPSAEYHWEARALCRLVDTPSLHHGGLLCDSQVGKHVCMIVLCLHNQQTQRFLYVLKYTFMKDGFSFVVFDKITSQEVCVAS